MNSPTTTQVPGTLPELAAIVARNLREHFPDSDHHVQQVMCLAEEAGEFVGAYRRWTGMARRAGSFDDVVAELADVLITVYVTANVLGTPTSGSYGQPRGQSACDPHWVALDVLAAAGEFVDVYLFQDRRLDIALARVISTVRAAADVLQIDLDAAWRAKAAVILTRGWRNQRT